MSSLFLFLAPKFYGLPGVWIGLTLFMGLRAVAGIVRCVATFQFFSIFIDILLLSLR
jgi:Na+-driven multidrug efflux pump